MLAKVENDVRRANRDVMYNKILSSVLGSILSWAEKKLIDYHECFQKGIPGLMENLLSLVLSASKILDENISNVSVVQERGDGIVDSTGSKVDYFIKSSLRNQMHLLRSIRLENDPHFGVVRLCDEDVAGVRTSLA